MKKILLLIILLLPLLLMEIYLRVDSNIYREILLTNSGFVEWEQAAPKINYWPDILVMGSSIARQSINPQEFQKNLKSNGSQLTVGNIAINASATSNDYLTLERILATCIKCPKKIIYQVTDISLKSKEVFRWKNTSLERILLLYFPNIRIDSVLKRAADNDTFYKQYMITLEIEKLFRTSFTGGRLISLINIGILDAVNTTNKDIYLPKYIDNDVEEFSFKNTLSGATIKKSLGFANDEIPNFKVGGATFIFYEEFLKLANENKIEVILLITPQHEIYQKTFFKDLHVFGNTIIESAEKHNLVLLDHRNYRANDNMFFYDLTHLNTEGAKHYSKYLSNKFVGLYGIKQD